MSPGTGTALTQWQRGHTQRGSGASGSFERRIVTSTSHPHVQRGWQTRSPFVVEAGWRTAVDVLCRSFVVNIAIVSGERPGGHELCVRYDAREDFCGGAAADADAIT